MSNIKFKAKVKHRATNKILTIRFESACKSNAESFLYIQGYELIEWLEVK